MSEKRNRGKAFDGTRNVKKFISDELLIDEEIRQAQKEREDNEKIERAAYNDVTNYQYWVTLLSR